MARQPLSVPVSLMLLVVGAATVYYVFHSNGWTWSGSIPVDVLWKHLSLISRAVTVGGLIMSAWGLGGLINGLAAKRL